MAWHYKANLHPKHYFLRPIRELIGAELPEELFGIDVLDGSPPCSTFSMVGSREKAWGKEKYFREGQAKQVLSDLFFDYLDLVEYLKPKVAVAENVKGMIAGNARGYAKMVMARFVEIGYRPQLFLVNAADCGVPQKRERVFFCAVRRDVSSKALKLAPASRWVSAGEACAALKLMKADLADTSPSPEAVQFWGRTKPGKSFAAAKQRSTGKANGFGRVRLDAGQPLTRTRP